MRTEGFHIFPQTDRLLYGRPAAEALAEEAERLGAKRVFIIASKSLNTKTDEIARIERALGDRHAMTIDGVAQHTTRKEAAAVGQQAKEAEADLVVCVGGGSAVDLAKIVIMAMEHDIRDEAGFDPYVIGANANLRAGETPFRAPSVRQLSIPSTLNGGEHNAGSLVTDERTKLKQIFYHRQMMPVSVILDPALTLHTPMDIWMGSGTRAMDHGIEALCSPMGTPLSDAVVLAGIRYLHDGMLATLKDPNDIEARRMSQFGSWMSAYGLQSAVPMGASHGIGHVLGGTCGVPHYFCTPALMPSVLRYNKPFTEEPQRRLAEALRAPETDAGDAFQRFVEQLGLPSSLSAVGIDASQFPLIASVAVQHRFVKANPRPMRTERDVIELLELAAGDGRI